MKRSGICDYCHEGSGVRTLCIDCQTRVDWWEGLTQEQKQDEYNSMDTYTAPDGHPL